MPKRGKTGPQIKLLGVLSFPMPLLVGIHLISWNTENPWIVGKGDHEAYDGLSECFRVCADNNTCYRDGWQDTDAGSATCRARGVPQGTGAVSTYVWWWAKTALNEITFQGAGGLTAGKLYIVAWCE